MQRRREQHATLGKHSLDRPSIHLSPLQEATSARIHRANQQTDSVHDIRVQEWSVDPRNPLPSSYDVREILGGNKCDSNETPRRQQSCGSCWAIAAVGVLRDRINLRYGCNTAPALSVQYLLNCARNCITFSDRGNTYTGCNESCKGGYIMAALLFAQMIGVPREENFVYTSNAGCQPKGECGKKGCPGIHDTMYTCDSVYSVTLNKSLFRQINTSGNMRETMTADQKERNAKNIMLEIYNRGSVCAVFNIFSDFLTYWGLPDRQRRVYTLGWDRRGDQKKAFLALSRDQQQFGNLNWDKSPTRGYNNAVGIAYEELHAVAIIGWGESESEGKYWIVRNSWGSTFSDDGTFLIKRGDNHLGIESSVFACWFNASTQSPVKASRGKYYWNPLQPLAMREMRVRQRNMVAGVMLFVVLLCVLYWMNSKLVKE